MANSDFTKIAPVSPFAEATDNTYSQQQENFDTFNDPLTTNVTNSWQTITNPSTDSEVEDIPHVYIHEDEEFGEVDPTNANVGGTSNPGIGDTQDIVMPEADFNKGEWLPMQAIKIHGFGFAPYEEPIVIKFGEDWFDSEICEIDGIGEKGTNSSIPYDPFVDTDSNAESHNIFGVAASENGEFTARIKLPPKLNEYTNEPLIHTKYAPKQYGVVAFAPASGTVYATFDGEPENVMHIDPVAQIVRFSDKSRLITSIGLFFASKDTSLPVNIELRNVTEGGLPGAKKLESFSIQSQYISVTGETKLTLPNPVFVPRNTPICFVVASRSTKYTLYTATIGQISKYRTKDDNKPVFIQKPAYVETLYVSENAASWLAKPDTDLKFKIYTAKISSTSGTIMFNNKSDFKVGESPTYAANGFISDFKAMIKDLSLANTGIVWYYSLDDGSTWNQFSNYKERKLNSTSTEIKFKGVLKTSDDTLSPLVQHNNNIVIGYLNDMVKNSIDSVNGTLYSTTSTLNKNIERVSLFVKHRLFGTSSFKVYVTVDGGIHWVEAIEDTAYDQKTIGNYQENKYKLKLQTGYTTTDGYGNNIIDSSGVWESLKSFKVRIDMVQSSYVDIPIIKYYMATVF